MVPEHRCPPALFGTAPTYTETETNRAAPTRRLKRSRRTDRGGQGGPVDADGLAGGDGDPAVPVQQPLGVDDGDADELVGRVVAEGVPFGRLVEVDGSARVTDVQVRTSALRSYAKLSKTTFPTVTFMDALRANAVRIWPNPPR